MGKTLSVIIIALSITIDQSPLTPEERAESARVLLCEFRNFKVTEQKMHPARVQADVNNHFEFAPNISEEFLHQQGLSVDQGPSKEIKLYTVKAECENFPVPGCFFSVGIRWAMIASWRDEEPVSIQGLFNLLSSNPDSISFLCGGMHTDLIRPFGRQILVERFHYPSVRTPELPDISSLLQADVCHNIFLVYAQLCEQIKEAAELFSDNFDRIGSAQPDDALE